MGLDKMSSYKDSSHLMHQHQFRFESKPPEKIVPFSKDVLEAIEQGDADTIAKLLGKTEFKEDSKIVVIFGQLGKGALFLITIPKMILQFMGKGFAGMGKEFDFQRTINTIISNIARGFQQVFSLPKAAVIAVVEALQKVTEAIAKAIGPKLDVMTAFVNEQAGKIADQLEKVMAWVDKTTKPVQNAIKAAYEYVGAQYEIAEKWIQKTAHKIYKPVHDASEAIARKLKEMTHKFMDTASTAFALLTHPFQTLQDLIVPFGFWLMRNVATPIGNIPKNIKHMIKQVRKAFGWLSKKGTSLVKLAVGTGKAAEKAARWVVSQVIPIAVGFWAWLLKVLRKIVQFIAQKREGFSYVVGLFWKALKADVGSLWVRLRDKTLTFNFKHKDTKKTQRHKESQNTEKT